MKKENFFKELKNKIKNANHMSDWGKNEKIKLIEKVEKINSNNVDDYIDVIDSFSISYGFWEWLKTITKYTENDIHRHIAMYGQKDTDIAVKAIKGILEVPHLTNEQIANLENHLKRMETEACEMTEEEWALTNLASIEKGFKTNEWYLAFIYNDENISNCEYCPHKNDTSDGCGQQHCYVKIHCQQQ